MFECLQSTAQQPQNRSDTPRIAAPVLRHNRLIAILFISTIHRLESVKLPCPLGEFWAGEQVSGFPPSIMPSMTVFADIPTARVGRDVSIAMVMQVVAGSPQGRIS